MSDLITEYATAAIDLQQMEAQKDGAYLERNRCVALIARMAIAAGLTAGTARTAIEGWSTDWHGCVYVDLPTGQTSWHFHDSQAWLFADLPAYTGAWDGHDTPEKYRRVGEAFSTPSQSGQVSTAPSTPLAPPAQPQEHLLKLSDLPAIGQPTEAGLFAGLTTKPDGTHCAVVLLADRPAKDLPWKQAMAWAKTLDAELPARPVSALLFANLKCEFDPDWHWTCEEFGSSSAWFQHFYDGTQYYNVQSFQARARAVRLIQLTT